jgi:hypothetical protein
MRIHYTRTELSTLSTPNRIEVMQSAQSDLAVLKKMKSTLRGTGGCKTLHLEFGIALHLLEDDDNIEVDLSGVEIPGFHVDNLVVETVGIHLGTDLTSRRLLIRCILRLERNSSDWVLSWWEKIVASPSTPTRNSGKTGG